MLLAPVWRTPQCPGEGKYLNKQDLRTIKGEKVKSLEEIEIANFLFLIFMMNLLLFKPIRKMLLERKAKINGLEDSIDSTQKEAVSQDEAFATGLKEARGKGLKEKEVLLQEASDEEKTIIDRINEKAQADLTEVRDKIAADTDAVKAKLIQEVDGFADIISEKILGRAV